jgi:hypothetical protein
MGTMIRAMSAFHLLRTPLAASEYERSEWRLRIWLQLAVACAVSLHSTSAHAACRFPADRINSPAKVAALLLETSDFVGFARVMRGLKTTTGQAEQVEVLLPFKGSLDLLTLENPVLSPGVLVVANSDPSFYAEPGAIVFGALTRTKEGWTRGECGQQLINKYPLPILVAELSRAVRR